MGSQIILEQFEIPLILLRYFRYLIFQHMSKKGDIWLYIPVKWQLKYGPFPDKT